MADAFHVSVAVGLTAVARFAGDVSVNDPGGTGAVDVAVNVIGEPVSELFVAVNIFVIPIVAPSVAVICVKPFASVVVCDCETEPPPVVTAQATEMPDTGTLLTLLTFTLSGEGSDVPATAD